MNGLNTHCRTLTVVPTVQEQPYCIFLAVSTNPGVLHYVSPEIAANILFPVQRQRESQGRICAKITDLLSYFCVLPTKEHLHSKGPGTIRTACTAQTVNLGWLSSTIQCGWRKREKKQKMEQGHHFSLLDSHPYFIVFGLKQSTGSELHFSNQHL